MSRHSGEYSDTSHLSYSRGIDNINMMSVHSSVGDYLQEDGSLAGQCIEVGRVSNYGQQIDDALVASMRGALSHSEGLRSVIFDRVRGATRKDPELMRLMDALLTTHYREKLPENLERFERYREGLSVLDGTVMYHSRVVVPVCLQEEVLEGLHAAHQGIEGMQARARETVFCPNITRDLVQSGAVSAT